MAQVLYTWLANGRGVGEVEPQGQLHWMHEYYRCQAGGYTAELLKVSFQQDVAGK